MDVPVIPDHLRRAFLRHAEALEATIAEESARLDGMAPGAEADTLREDIEELRALRRTYLSLGEVGDFSKAA